MAISRAGRVVSVGGGGGVGKSAVASNLAAALTRDGLRTVLVDAAAPGRSQRLARQVRALDAEVVVIDLGGAPDAEALEAFDAADLRLVVTTPRLADAEAAYAIMGGAVLRRLRRVAAATGQRASIDEALARPEPSFSTAQLLARLAQEVPALATSLQAGLAGFGFRLVGNQVVEARETNLIFALSRMAHDFLGVEAPVLASLRVSEGLRASQGAGCPYLLQAGVEGEECAVTFQTMARALRTAPLTGARALTAPEDAGDPPGAAALPAALPVNVADYERAYQRHLVDLPATLVYPGGLLPATMQDVSEGGALLALERPPPVGTRVTLVVPGLGDHPGLACVVRHADAARRRAGVQFLADREEARRTADAIRLAGIDRRIDGQFGTGRCL